MNLMSKQRHAEAISCRSNCAGEHGHVEAIVREEDGDVEAIVREDDGDVEATCDVEAT